MSLYSSFYKRTRIITITVALLISIPLISCVTRNALENEFDETAPEVSVTVNGTALKDQEEVSKFENMHISNLIVVRGMAKDEQSGVRDIAVGTNLKLQCGLDQEIIYHATADRPDWHRDPVYTGYGVDESHITTHNFRLWYLQEKCGKLPLVQAYGDIYVTARNHFGQTTTQSYKVKFTPSSWR